MKANIQMNVRSINSAISMIEVHGEINSFAEAALTEAYNQAAESGARAILLNFEGLEYMNSSGIGLLVTLLVRAQRQKKILAALGLNDHYRQIFELTRLNEAIQLFNQETEAIKALS